MRHIKKRVLATVLLLACLVAPQLASAQEDFLPDPGLSRAAKLVGDAKRLALDCKLAPACTMYLRVCSMRSPTPWLVATDVDACVTGIYRWAGNGWAQEHMWPCTPGAPETPTRLGVYGIGERAEVSYALDFSDMFFYYTQYSGYYLYHSVTYYPGGGVKDARLGLHLSHGCVRLSLENARWMYENIPEGTLVYLY